MFDITQFLTLDISIYLALAGALFYYLGRVIGSTRVADYDRMVCYIYGLFFSVIYIVIPLMLIHLISEYVRLPSNFFIIPTSVILIALQVMVFCFLSLNFKANYYLRRFGLLDEYKKQLEKVSNLAQEHTEVFKEIFGMDYIRINTLIHYEIPIKIGNRYILFIFSLITLASTYYFFMRENLLSFSISLLLTFFIITLSATALGYKTAHYPQAKIYLDNGNTLQGKILRYDDLVHILSEDRHIQVNKEKIMYIEKPLYKKELNPLEHPIIKKILPYLSEKDKNDETKKGEKLN